MCRILAVESAQTPEEIADWLRKFAVMAKNSPAPPDEDNPKGSPQENGWGMSLFFARETQVKYMRDFFDLLIVAFGNKQSAVDYASTAAGFWVFFTSLEKVWEEVENIAQALESQKLPKAKMLVHARAATNEKEIGDIELNMPFKIDIDGEILSFAFNGHFSGATAKILQEKLRVL